MSAKRKGAEEESCLFEPINENGDGRMAKNFVTVKGDKYYVKNGTLALRKKGIIDLKKTKGLEQLVHLQELDQGGNNIEEIKGLEKLTNLQILNLNHNLIEVIKGFEHFTNLQELNLRSNYINEIKGLRTSLTFKNYTLVMI